MKITLLIVVFCIVVLIHSKKKMRLLKSQQRLQQRLKYDSKSDHKQEQQKRIEGQQIRLVKQDIEHNYDNDNDVEVKNESELDRRLRAMEMDGIESTSVNSQRKLRRRKLFGGSGLLTRIAEIGGKMVDKFAATGAGKWLSRLKMPQSVLNKASKLGNSYLFQKGAKYGNVFMAKYGDDILARSKDIGKFGMDFYAKNGVYVDRLAFDFYNRAMKPAEDINSKKDNIVLVPVITPVLQSSSGMKEYPQAIQGQTQYPLIPRITDVETLQKQIKDEEKLKKEQGAEETTKRLRKKNRFRR